MVTRSTSSCISVLDVATGSRKKIGNLYNSLTMDIITIINIWQTGKLPDSLDLLLSINNTVITASSIAIKAASMPINISLLEMLAQELEMYEAMILDINAKIKSLTISDINA